MTQFVPSASAIEERLKTLTDSALTVESDGLVFEIVIPGKESLKKLRDIEKEMRKADENYPLRDLASECLPECCRIKGEAEARQGEGLEPVVRTADEWNRIEIALQDESGISDLSIMATKVCGFGIQASGLARMKKTVIDTFEKAVEKMEEEVEAEVGEIPS